MYLFAGLGNKGEKYAFTRHNVGFMVIDAMKEILQGEEKIAFKGTRKSQYALVSFNSEKIVLLKPQTYMNLSGESVLEMTTYFKIEKKNVFVIVDDFDLPFGKIRVRPNGSAGTHNGLKSVERHIGSDYVRLRCGIQSKTDLPIDQFVLSDFSKEERDELPSFTRFIAEAAIDIIRHDVHFVMNSYNNKHFLEAVE